MGSSSPIFRMNHKKYLSYHQLRSPFLREVRSKWTGDHSNQRWKFHPVSSGSFLIKNFQASSAPHWKGHWIHWSMVTSKGQVGDCHGVAWVWLVFFVWLLPKERREDTMMTDIYAWKIPRTSPRHDPNLRLPSNKFTLSLNKGPTEKTKKKRLVFPVPWDNQG